MQNALLKCATLKVLLFSFYKSINLGFSVVAKYELQNHLFPNQNAISSRYFNTLEMVR